MPVQVQAKVNNIPAQLICLREELSLLADKLVVDVYKLVDLEFNSFFFLWVVPFIETTETLKLIYIRILLSVPNLVP